jgi:hypothetical protein
MDKLSYSLSDSEIRNFFQGKVNILKFSELTGKTLVDVLGKYLKCVVLFEDKPDRGHWCLLHVVKGKYLEWFDSYGIIPENEFDYIPKSFLKLSMQERGTLIKLLLSSSLQCRYSQYRLQQLKNGINTCGKWCCVRGLFNDIDENDFHALMTDYKGFSPDQIVNKIYLNLAKI